MRDPTVREALADLPPSSKFVYNVLERDGTMTLKELTEETLLGSRTARYGLSKLRDADLVREAPALHDGRQTCYSVSHRSLGESRTTYPETALVHPDALERALETVGGDDAAFRLLEVSGTYAEGHVPGAVELDPESEFSDARGVPRPAHLEDVLGERGITPDTTVVVYGEENNEDAAFVYWVLAYYGHRDVRLLDGGKRHWRDSDYALTTDVPAVTARTYSLVRAPDEDVRAYREDVRDALATDAALVDVRTRAEYCGETDAPARVSGHIPQTVNLEWTSVLREDGRFRPRGDLADAVADLGVDPDDDVIVYCNFGERSALVWVALSELLGFERVANYDGSWTEWGNLVDAPIETCDSAADDD